MQKDLVHSIYNDEPEEEVERLFNKFKHAVLWYSNEEQKYKEVYNQPVPIYDIVELNECDEPVQPMQLHSKELQADYNFNDFQGEDTYLKYNSVTYDTLHGSSFKLEASTENILAQNQLITAGRRFLEAAEDLDKQTLGSKYFNSRVKEYKEHAQRIISGLLPPLQNNKERLFNRLSLSELLDFCDRAAHYREALVIKNAGLYTGISDEELRKQAQRLYEGYGLKPESIRGSSFEQVVLEQLF